jgi:hypothetical protein
VDRWHLLMSRPHTTRMIMLVLFWLGEWIRRRGS